MTDEYTFAPEYQYGGQWFDDMGAALLALGQPGLARDLTRADIPRDQLDEIIYRLGANRATEGDLNT